MNLGTVIINGLAVLELQNDRQRFACMSRHVSSLGPALVLATLSSISILAEPDPSKLNIPLIREHRSTSAHHKPLSGSTPQPTNSSIPLPYAPKRCSHNPSPTPLHKSCYRPFSQPHHPPQSFVAPQSKPHTWNNRDTNSSSPPSKCKMFPTPKKLKKEAFED